MQKGHWTTPHLGVLIEIAFVDIVNAGLEACQASYHDILIVFASLKFYKYHPKSLTSGTSIILHINVSLQAVELDIHRYHHG